MTISMRSIAVDSFAPMLKSLSAILDKGADHVGTTGADLVGARLAPDMYTLGQQVHTACLQAANGIARLADKTAPSEPGGEKTLDELKARIARTIGFVESVTETDLAGSEARDCTIHAPNGIVFAMNGLEFLRSWALPHFYFHVVTAYDILRREGVELGKKDYLSQVAAYIR